MCACEKKIQKVSYLFLWVTFFINSVLEDDKSGKGSEQLQIVNFSDRSLGWVWAKQVVSFWYDINIYLVQFAWFCRPANNNWLLDSCLAWQMDNLKHNLKFNSGGHEKWHCQSLMMPSIFFSDEQLNIDLKIRHIKISKKKIFWAKISPGLTKDLLRVKIVCWLVYWQIFTEVFKG